MTSPALRYVALGDSTGTGVGAQEGGYPDRLARRAARHGVPVDLVNLAVPGARAIDVAERQLAPALTARPAIVTLGIGINDVTLGTDVEAFARDYDRVAAALAATGARVLVANVLDVSRLPTIPAAELRRARERTVAVNHHIAAAAARHGLALVDLFGWTVDLALHPDLLSVDRFHPSDAGYERWTDAMEATFLAAVRALHAERRPGAGSAD